MGDNIALAEAQKASDISNENSAKIINLETKIIEDKHTSASAQTKITDSAPKKGRGQKTAPALSLIKILVLSFISFLISLWGGFGLPAWVAIGCVLFFVAGMIKSTRDYRRILHNDVYSH